MSACWIIHGRAYGDDDDSIISYDKDIGGLDAAKDEFVIDMGGSLPNPEETDDEYGHVYIFNTWEADNFKVV